MVLMMNPINIDVLKHEIPGIHGPWDLEGLKRILGDPEEIQDNGDTERWYFPCALVDVVKATRLMELIDFTPEAPIKVFGKDPFRDASALNEIISHSTDWEQHWPMGDHYFYDLMIALYFDSEGDLSESTFGFFWANMPPRRKQV